jgi:hypothetical protein
VHKKYKAELDDNNAFILIKCENTVVIKIQNTNNCRSVLLFDDFSIACDVSTGQETFFMHFDIIAKTRQRHPLIEQSSNNCINRVKMSNTLTDGVFLDYKNDTCRIATFKSPNVLAELRKMFPKQGTRLKTYFDNNNGVEGFYDNQRDYGSTVFREDYNLYYYVCDGQTPLNPDQVIPEDKLPTFTLEKMLDKEQTKDEMWEMWNLVGRKYTYLAIQRSDMVIVHYSPKGVIDAICTTHVRGSYIYIDTIASHVTHGMKNVGEAMIRSLEQIAMKIGLVGICLHSLLDSVGYYTKQGFDMQYWNRCEEKIVDESGTVSHTDTLIFGVKHNNAAAHIALYKELSIQPVSGSHSFLTVPFGEKEQFCFGKNDSCGQTLDSGAEIMSSQQLVIMRKDKLVPYTFYALNKEKTKNVKYTFQSERVLFMVKSESPRHMVRQVENDYFINNGKGFIKITNDGKVQELEPLKVDFPIDSFGYLGNNIVWYYTVDGTYHEDIIVESPLSITKRKNSECIDDIDDNDDNKTKKRRIIIPSNGTLQTTVTG